MQKKVLLLTILCTVAVMCVALNAFSQSYQSLTPLLVDIAGWDADSPEGMDMDMSGMKSVTAVREYEQGDKSATAAIIFGQQMYGMWNPVYQEGFKMESSEGSLEVERIKGFIVVHTFDKSSSDGGIVVLIQEPSQDGTGGAIFSLAYEGMNKDEAMKLVQKFDWNAMKSRVSKM